jgi:cbb3-type cytochrome oxidase subunit 1
MLGIGLGAAFSLDRSLGAGLRPLHAELNLWGWVTLLIYGMGYHMLPRFAGRPLRWTRLADLQSFLAIAGVALASAGWIALVLAIPLARVVVLSGGALEAVAALLFALEIAGLLRPHPA